VYSLTPLPHICVQAGPGGLEAGREDLCTLSPLERICVLSDPPTPYFVFRTDLVDWRQVERICVLSHPWRGYVYSLIPYPLFVFRPDLVDWRQVERRQVRERIDLAFHVMDREYGVTRLLDPEGKPMK
jgi:hypothetical protein